MQRWGHERWLTSMKRGLSAAWPTPDRRWSRTLCLSLGWVTLDLRTLNHATTALVENKLIWEVDTLKTIEMIAHDRDESALPYPNTSMHVST